MNRIAILLVLGSLMTLQGCCSSKSSENQYTLTDCGIRLDLPTHFGAPSHSGGCNYEWSSNGGMMTLQISSALPGDTGTETDAKTAMPGQNVDYSRAASFGPYPGKERRTQQKVGAQNRAVWTGFFTGPKGAVNVKVSSIQKESADEFGEQFWKNLRTNLIRSPK